MTRPLYFALVVLLLSGLMRADETQVQALRSIGAEIRVEDGLVTSLKIDCEELDADDYRLIGKTESLKSLTVGGRPSTLNDRSLELLKGLRNLEFIQLDGVELSDEGFRHFAAFKQLKRLSLFHPSRDRHDFTGAGLAYLKMLPELERLTFAGATAGDEAMRAVGQLTQLRDFSQWHNWDTSAGILYLRALPQLRSLKIGQRLPGRGRSNAPSLDDKTLETIAQMRSLERLEIQEARLSLAGWRQLKSLPKLRELTVRWVDTPADDVDRLRELLPGVTLQWTEMTAEERQTILESKLKL